MIKPRRVLARMCVSLWLLGSGGACEDDASTGRACKADEACGASICAARAPSSTEDLSPLELVCGNAREGAVAEAVCERASQCGNGVCLLAGACADVCDQDSQCTAGLRCANVYARAGARSLATVRACVRSVVLPDGARVESEVRDAALVRGVATVALEPAADSGTVYVLEHLDDDSWPVPDPMSSCRPALCARRLSTLGAAPRVLFDLDALADDPDGPDDAIASGDHVNPLTLAIPNSPRAPLSAAGYALELEAKRAGSLRVTRLSRAESGQRLDLNVYYVGAAGLSPEGDRGPAQLSAALEEVDRVLGQADIFLGEVRQIEIAGELLERGAKLPDAAASPGFARLRSQYQVLPQLPELFKLSAGAANSALDVFLVSDIEASGGDVGGIAGGTPVAFGMHGTAGSGIAIATDMYLAAENPTKLGRTLAHEIGHALGLFHTTEIDGRVFDPLPDTPVCPLSQDLNHDGLLDAGECAAYGGDNLMFPTSDTAETQLSAQQVEVLRRALLLQ